MNLQGFDMEKKTAKERFQEMMRGIPVDSHLRELVDSFNPTEAEAARWVEVLLKGWSHLDEAEAALEKVKEAASKTPIKKVFVLTDTIKSIRLEDGGVNVVADIEDKDEANLFVRLHSSDVKLKHPELKSMEGKTIQVTIEILD